MSDAEPEPQRMSARILGGLLGGLTSEEAHRVLKDEGFLEGEPGAYRVTDKGEPFANDQHHHRGTGGYAHYNRRWDTRTWHKSIIDVLHVDDERREHVRDAVRADRADRKAKREAEAEAYWEQQRKDEEDAQAAAAAKEAAVVRAIWIVVAAVATVVVMLVIVRGWPRFKQAWIDHVVPRWRRVRGKEPREIEPSRD